MTEASYTAWDDKQYVWPPPDGWYQASDSKWWPEGYGPQPDPAEAVTEAAATEAVVGTDAANNVGAAAESTFDASADAVDSGFNTASSAAADATDAVGTAADDAARTAVMPGESFGAVAGGAFQAAVDAADDGADGAVGTLGTSLDDAHDGFGDAIADSKDSVGTFGGGLAELGNTVSDGASGISDQAADVVDGATSEFTDGASGVVDGASGVVDGASGLVDGAGGLAAGASGLDDLLPGADDRLSISDVDGLPTSDVGELGSLDGMTERVSDLGDVSTPSLGDLPSPGLSDLPAPDLGDGLLPDLDSSPGELSDLGDLGDLGDVGEIDERVDDIPSVRDLASPDLDLSDIPSGDVLDNPLTGEVLDTDVTQVVPTDVAGQFSDPLPPPPGNAGTADAFGDLPDTQVDGPSMDAPGFDAPPPPGDGHQPSNFAAPGAAPEIGAAPAFEQATPGFDQPPLDQSMPGAPTPAAPGFGSAMPAPTGFQQDILASNKGSGRGKKLMLILLGVLALAAIGVLLYWQFGRGEDGSADASAAAVGPGSVNEPHPRTTGVVVFYPDGDVDQRWVIEVLDPVAVGSGDLSAGSDDGDVFAVTTVRVRNESGSDGASVGDLRFNAVNAAGVLIDRESNQCPATADDLDYGAAVPLGGEVVGAVCWELPAADLDGLKLGLESEKVAGRVHISLQ